ncbi:MAG: NAD(P)H-dependent oxidoreductase [Ruminiclostridium sp.]|nr:NAD(P)H-dependent oxidoreductase [Ruminiclostridium sp.]
MNKVLVAYFSATGVTADKAKAIAEAANGDLYEIRPAVPYTKEDLDFKNKQSRSSVEMSDLGSRPEIADKNANVEAYDTVFLGFPIWWYMAPTIVNTFLESYDFSGKTVILFATSDGSRFGKTLQNLKASVPESTVIKEGRILSKVQPLVIASWVKELGYGE